MSADLRRCALDFEFTVANELDVDLDSYFETFDPATPIAAGNAATRLEFRRADDDFFELSIDGHLAFRTLDLAVLLHQTIWEITRRAVDAVPNCVVLHAAVVVLDGTQVLVSGPSGAGKSTLTAALLALGSVYLTDEAVVVERNGRLGAIVRRPIQLSAHSLAMLGLDDVVPLRLPDGSGYLPIPPHARRPGDDEAIAIVTLEGQAGPLTIRRPRRSELAAGLVRESFADHALSQHGLEIVKELSTRCVHIALSGGSVTERANAVSILVQTP